MKFVKIDRRLCFECVGSVGGDGWWVGFEGVEGREEGGERVVGEDMKGWGIDLWKRNF